MMTLNTIIMKRLYFILIIFYFLFSVFPLSAFAQSEEEKAFLLMYFKEEELQIISTTRSLKSITRVAEDVEVITASDIELTNAHTLADVLNTVNGVQVFIGGGSPGSFASPIIQGSDSRHVAVFLDGVSMNNLADNVAEIAVIPVQSIEKIEIIKGPASSSWGSSLGGVINVITKSPGIKESIGGTLSASYGERNTEDFRAEAYGKKDGFGYYLSAGRLHSNGLRPTQEFSENNVYSKLSYDITRDTNVILTLLYNKGDREEGDFSAYDFAFADKFENLFSSLSLNSAISSELNLNVSLKAASQKINFLTTIISTGETGAVDFDDKKYGASIKLTWKHNIHSAVSGIDYDNWTAKSNTFTNGELKEKKWAFFINDTIVLDKLSITPGIRYDLISISDNFLSPSLGVTYEIPKKTLLRAYVARGFSLPGLQATDADGIFFRHNPDLKVEKVWSYQLGVETGALKYLWLKISGFRHDVKDGIVREDLTDSLWTVINKNRIRRQGFEVEIRTVPIYNFTLSAGSTFIDTDDLDTGEDIKGVPRYTYDVGLQYDDKKSFRALLKGHYIWWNSEGDSAANYNAFVFDLNMIKILYRGRESRIEAFLTAHNIFNGSQYWHTIYKNAGRWFETGLKCKF